jgi:hypothetical protein
MAKQVIVMGYEQDSQQTVYDCLFWYPMASGLKPQASGSAWPGASTAENQAILNGSIVEIRQAVTVPTGIQLTSLEDVIQRIWTNKNAALSGIGANKFQGSYWDGSAWTIVPN